MSDTPKGPVAFRYNAAAYECGIIRREEGVCGVCGRPREWFYTGAVYCAGPAPRVCAECLHSGEAARKFDATFITRGSRLVTDPAKADELYHRTPGYPSWQGDFFPYCCDDYCTFLGDVGTEELEAMGIADAVFADYEERGGDPRVREVLQAVGQTAGYHLYVDRE